MRWLISALLTANFLLWYAADFWVPETTRTIATDQSLPRVSTLKITDDGDQAQKAEREVEPVGLSCVRLGWFDTATDALDAYRALGTPGENYSVSELERQLPPLHWVIIPPQSEDRALALFNDLQRRGIDSYLVTRGENTNAISLGLFQSKDAAERVLEAKKRQNLSAVLANFPRNQISYALVFEVSPAINIEVRERRIRDYQEDFEMVEISPCEGIATTPENP